MTFSIELPDSLVPAVDAFIAAQLDESGNQKYADEQDLIQQNLNTGLFKYFVDQAVQAALAEQLASVTATVQAQFALTPAKAQVVSNQLKPGGSISAPAIKG